MNNTPVTTRIIQRPSKDKQGLYEQWLNEIIPVAKSFEGHRGVNVIRPHHPHEDYTIILHFDSEQSLQNWLESKERLALVEKIRPHLSIDEIIEIETGLEFWFTPPAVNLRAPAYKQFLITLSAIFPLSQLIPLLLQPLFEMLHIDDIRLLAGFITAAAIVVLMVYVIMPRYTKMVSAWLYRV